MLSLGFFIHFTQREFRKCWTKTPQMDPTCKSVISSLKFLLILPKMLDEMFDRDQTSSSIIQHDFFLLFVFFENFRHLKCVQNFIQYTKFAMLDAFELAFSYCKINTKSLLVRIKYKFEQIQENVFFLCNFMQ